MRLPDVEPYIIGVQSPTWRCCSWKSCEGQGFLGSRTEPQRNLTYSNTKSISHQWFYLYHLLLWSSKNHYEMYVVIDRGNHINWEYNSWSHKRICLCQCVSYQCALHNRSLVSNLTTMSMKVLWRVRVSGSRSEPVVPASLVGEPALSPASLLHPAGGGSCTTLKQESNKGCVK